MRKYLKKRSGITVAAAAAISIMNYTVVATASTLLTIDFPLQRCCLNSSFSSFRRRGFGVNEKRLFTTSSSLCYPLAFANYGIINTREGKTTTTTASFFSSSSKEEVEKSTQKSESTTKFATDYHAPVMPKECISALLKCQRATQHQNKNKKQPLIFIDGTLGGGGHSLALLQQLNEGDIVIGCDVDPNALREACTRLEEYIVKEETKEEKRDKPMFIPVRSNFRDLLYTLLEEDGGGVRHPVTGDFLFDMKKSKEGESNCGGAPGVDGILLDFGVSSHQIDDPDRGFAFMKDGPLDMRMSRGSTNTAEHEDEDEDYYVGGGFTAADICNEFDENELKRILRSYGDEPRASKIAKSIINHRPLHTTQDLMAAIANVTPEFAKKGRRMGRTATAARVFQSLRIVVNEEDVALRDVLMNVAPTMVRPGGRLVALSYHSMEDRATKRVMRDGTVEKRRGVAVVERDLYGNVVDDERYPRYWKPLGKAKKAMEEEVEVNPRARSATLRIAERLDK